MRYFIIGVAVLGMWASEALARNKVVTKRGPTYRGKTTKVVSTRAPFYSTRPSPLSMGVGGRVGGGIAGFSEAGELGPRVGWSIGGNFSLTFVDMLGLQIDALLSKKGGGDSDERREVLIDLTYLDFPILAKVKIPHIVVTPTFFLGLSFGINIGAQYRYNVAGESGSKDIKEDVNGTELGGTIGLGCDIKLPQGTIPIEIRFTRGWSSVFRDHEEIKSGALMLMVGYCHSIGR